MLDMQSFLKILVEGLKNFLAALPKSRVQSTPVPITPSPAPQSITPLVVVPPVPEPAPAPIVPQPTQIQIQRTGFLVCPIQATDDKGNPVTSRTAKISAIVDHSGTAIDPQSTKRWGVNAKDQKVRAFNGEIGQGPQCPQEPCGYPSAGTTEFFAKKEINYVGVASDGGKKILQYDGHAGYDFAYSLNTQIVAPADGTLCKAKRGDDLIYGASWDKDHSFYIKHDNDFVTWFRHSNNLEGSIEQKLTTSPNARVSKGEKIARLGNFENYKVGGTAVHLHFEVRNPQGEITDPYQDQTWEDY